MPENQPNPDIAENEPPTTLGQELFGIVRLIIFAAPIFVVLTLAMLAMLGPAVGNIFSNIVSQL